MRTYSELIQLSSFEDRLKYLKLNGVVANETFGFDRYLNQKFYRSPEWKRLRDQIIIRDKGCDLACKGHNIYGKIIVHHMNPISIEDVEENRDSLFNPEYLVCASLDTHNYIHYGYEQKEKSVFTERCPGDTKLWR